VRKCDKAEIKRIAKKRRKNEEGNDSDKEGDAGW